MRRLAELANVHYLTVFNIENRRKDPRLSTLEKIAKAFGVPVAALLNGILSQTNRPPKGKPGAKSRRLS